MSPERNFLLAKVHGIDSTWIPTFGDVTGTEEIKAVRQHTSVLQTILKLFAWDELNKSIERHDAKGCASGFSFKSQLVAMLYGQLAGPSRSSVRMRSTLPSAACKGPRSPALEPIELFFRWVKQVLKIRHFPGVSENAVRIQIAVALIAFLLLRLAQQMQKAIESPLTFARLVRANLMHLRGLNELLEPPRKPNPVLGQGLLI